MNAIKEIIEWTLKSLSPWEGDIVRRLLENGTISQVETNEIIENASAAYAIIECSTAQLLQPTYNPQTTAKEIANEPIKLCAINAVVNINAINDNTKLPFSHEGITIIYGENGSGKSGYTRILKNACYAKYVEPEILANVYKPSLNAQSATIVFKKDGIKQEWKWTPGTFLTELSDINVYDVDCGKIILEKNNQITYKPKGAEIFDEVSNILELVKTSLTSKILNVTLPVVEGIDQFPTSKQWLNKINEKTKIDEIGKNTMWTPQHQISTETLTKLIQEYESGTTQKKITAIKEILEKRLPRAIEKLGKCLEVLSADKAEKIKNLTKKNEELKAAHTLASAAYNTKEPLDGVHSSEWKLLFEAAREYSEKIAYAGHNFPNLAENSSCVLCMSDLDSSAKSRMNRFDSYMKDKTKELFDEGTKDFKNTISEITNTITPDQEMFEPLCNDLKELLGTDYDISVSFEILRKRKEYLGLEVKTFDYPSLVISSEKINDDAKEALNKKLSEFLVLITPEKHQQNISNNAELIFKKSLNKSGDLILKYVENLKFNAKITSAIASIKATKQKFSTKAKSIVAQTVTPEFIENFKDELKFLDVGLTVDISPIVRDLDTSHSFSIASKRPGKVLSEGEQKVISIAAFLAELKTFKNLSPIIFDDPVSSLDHIYRENIAHRLAIEALNRQVVIFTHDVSFIAELEGKLEEMALRGKPVFSTIFSIKRNGIDSGFVSKNSPWRGMTTPQRAQQLEEELNAIKQTYQTDGDTYNKNAALIYCRLREAWESLVEQDLLCQIVNRGRNSIQTLRLKELVIDPNDADTIDRNMSKSSNWMYGHAKSKALTDNRPNPNDLLNDINELRTFAKLLAERKKLRNNQRNAYLKAETSEIG